MAISTAPDNSGMHIKIFDLVNGALPNWDTDVVTTYANAVHVGHVDTFSDGGESREVKKYKALNEKDFDEIVSVDSISREPFSMTVLFDPEDNTLGVAKCKKAFEENIQIGLYFELTNAKTDGGNGTTYAGIVKLSKFSTTFEKGGKYTAELTCEKIGKPVKHDAK